MIISFIPIFNNLPFEHPMMATSDFKKPWRRNKVRSRDGDETSSGGEEERSGRIGVRG